MSNLQPTNTAPVKEVVNQAAGVETLKKDIPAIEKPFVQSVLKTDVNIKVLTEADMLSDAIEAKPFQVPEMLNVKLKDKSYTARWINRKSMDGSWLNRWVAMGFTKVYTEEIEGTLPTEVNAGKDEITIHDVILMKVGTLQLLQALKYNHEKSLAMVSPKNTQDAAFAKAVSQLRQELGGSISPELKGKVEFYKPSEKSAEALNT